MRKAPFFALVAGATTAADLATKALVEATLNPFEARPVVDGLFNLVHARNPGAAFGILAGSPGLRVPLFIGITLLALAGIVWLYVKTERRLEGLGLALVFGGALGNLVDRVRYGEVVDFLDVYWGTYHWPAFNVADSAIVVGAALLLYSEFTRKKAAA